MITKELEEYIRYERAKGVSDEDIQKALRANGWARADIAEALGHISPPVTNVNFLEQRERVLKTRKKIKRSIILIILCFVLVVGLVTFLINDVAVSVLEKFNVPEEMIEQVANLSLETGASSEVSKRIEFELLTLESKTSAHLRSTGSFVGFCNANFIAGVRIKLSKKQNEDLICRDAKGGVVVYLKKSGGKFLCADSTGFGEMIGQEPKGLTCVGG